MATIVNSYPLNEAQYRSIIDNSLDAIMIVDVQGTIVRINQAVTELFSYPQATLLGEQLTLLRFSSCSTGHCDLDKGFSAKFPFHIDQTCEVTAVDGKNNPIRLRLNFTSIESANTSPLFCAIFQNITLQKQAEEAIASHNKTLALEVKSRTEQLEKARDHAEQANKAKSYFLANMSHELRTPLHGILSFANMGFRRADKMTTEKVVTYFELIDSA